MASDSYFSQVFETRKISALQTTEKLNVKYSPPWKVAHCVPFSAHKLILWCPTNSVHQAQTSTLSYTNITNLKMHVQRIMRVSKSSVMCLLVQQREV